MALLQDFGNPDNDAGEWIAVGTDAKTGVPIRLRVRPMPADIARQMFRKHMRSDDKLASDGVMVRQIDDIAANELSRAVWCLLDCENVSVLVQDSDAAKFYSRALGREGQIEPGEEVVLDGKLTDQIKERILSKRQDLRDVIIKAASRIEQDRGTQLKSLEGNS